MEDERKDIKRFVFFVFSKIAGLIYEYTQMALHGIFPP